MFLNPVCHWGDLPYPEPLFEEDFRAGPPPMEFPTTTDWYTDRGFSAPMCIFDFETTSGNEVDHIGGVSLTPQNSPRQGVTAWGLRTGPRVWDGSDAHWDDKKCVEFEWGSSQRLIAANSSILEFDATSFAWMCVYRTQHKDVSFNAPVGSYGALFVKLSEPIVHVWRGYGLHAGGASVYDPTALIGETDGFSATLSARGFIDQCRWNQWTVGIFAMNRATQRDYQVWPGGARAPEIHVGVPTAANDGVFRVGAGLTFNHVVNQAALAQVAYLAFWEGADAEALGDLTALRNSFWTEQNADPGGYFEPTGYYPNVVSHNNEGAMGVIHNTPNEHVRCREVGHEMTPYHDYAGFSHAARVGMDCHLIMPKCWTDTDAFEGGGWTKNNVSVTYANADLDECPTGMVMGKKIRATANAAQLYRNATCVVGGTNMLSLFFKRHSSMGADVTGRFRVLNLTTMNYDYDVAFTATRYWQWHSARVGVANVGCRIVIEIDNQDDAISLYRATAAQGQGDYSLRGEATVEHYALAKMSAVEDYLKAAQGEIEIVFGIDYWNIQGKYFFDSDDASGTDDPDSRTARGNSYDLAFLVYTGGGVLHNQTDTGVNMNGWTVPVAGSGTENKVILQWNYNVPFSGGAYTQLYQNGIWYNGSPAGWAINGAKLKRLWLGCKGGNIGGLHNSGMGNIAYIRIWEHPWRNL